MFNYIRGELYRLLRKKSMYIYLSALAIFYFLLTYAFSGHGYTAESIVNNAETFFPFLPTLVGGYLFAALYLDDLSSKTLATLVGYGLGKLKIVISKCLLMTLLGAVIFGLIPLFVVAVYTVFGVLPTAAAFGFVYVYALKALLTTIAFAALAGIVVYGVQRNTFAIVLYIALAFGIVSQIVSLLLNTAIVRGIAPGLDQHLMSGITARIQEGLSSGQSALWVFGEYIIYVLAALVLSALAFHKKELEF